VVVFKGDENPAKEWECVLIYDEATQTFTLEKLDSLVNLNFDTKTRSRTRPTAPSRTSSSFHMLSSLFHHLASVRVRAMLTTELRTHSTQWLLLFRRADTTTFPSAHGG
jgi:hypothetical protein